VTRILTPAPRRAGLELRVAERGVDRRARDRQQPAFVEPEALGADRVLAADRGAEVGRVVRAQRHPDPGLGEARQRVLLVAGVHAEHDVAGRARVQHDRPRRQLLDESRVLDRPDAVVDPRDRQPQCRTHAFGPGPLAGVDCAAEAGRRCDLVRRRELIDGVTRLVARHREADDVGVR